MTAINSAQYNDTKIQLDGEALTLKDQCVTVVNDGTTWGFNTVPIRAFFEAVDYTVDWDRTSNTILLESPLTDLETVAKNCKDSCVMIYSYLPDGTILQGSGWVYDGYVVTAKHVVDGATKIDVFFDDSKYSMGASVVPIETELDVAVLVTYTTKPSVALGDSDKLNEGEKLVSITSPKGAQNTVEECIYSGLTNSRDRIRIADTSMTGGSSGGAIFNFDGDIIGMNLSEVNDTDGIISAISVNDVKPILEQIK